ncbi:MAG: hypothetical protein KDA96_16040, partial [Planctomycetaceae bacterium]|nr:hypothetical protein [Planctomycetaceae bacterium]
MSVPIMSHQRETPHETARIHGTRRTIALMFVLFAAIIAGCQPEIDQQSVGSESGQVLVMTTSRPLFEMAQQVVGPESTSVIIESAIPDDTPSRLWNVDRARIPQMQTAPR